MPSGLLLFNARMAIYISNAVVITAMFILSKVSNVRGSGNMKADCWKECKGIQRVRDSHNLLTKYVSSAGKGRISSFTISGCEETCNGRGGPLCVIERGKTAHAELHFKVGELL